jgi:nucleoside-triphosphatase
MASKNILVTGPPRIGKTTLIIKLAEKLKHLSPVGFYTSEVKKNNIRTGFNLVGLDGQKSLLAHVNLSSAYKVGKYRVDVQGFEWFLEQIKLNEAAGGLIIIDEIGKMECLSAKFQELIRQLFEADIQIIATISLKGGGLIKELKIRSDVEIFELTRNNRDKVFKDILKFTSRRK